MKWYKVCAAAAVMVALAGEASAAVSAVHEEKTNWDVTYPAVTMEGNPAAQVINADLMSQISGLKKGFDSGEYYRASCSYEVHYEDAGILSVSLHLFGLPYGANGNHSSVVSVVYDKETGARVPLENYVHVTLEDLEIYRYGHTYTWDGAPMEYENTFKEPISYIPTHYFLPGGGAVCLVYEPYDLAPGVYGSLYIRLAPEYVEYLNRKNR